MSPLPTFVRGRGTAHGSTEPPPPGGSAPRRAAPAPRVPGPPRTGALRAHLGRVLGDLTGLRTHLTDAAAPAVARIRRLVGPYAAMVTAVGWLVIGGAVALGVLGWMRGWLEFRTLSLMLALLGIVAVVLTLGRWEYDAAIELADRRVRIGDSALGRVEVRNASRRPAASTRVELPVGRNVAPFRVPRLAPAESHEEVFQVPARRRGVITIGPVRSVRSDPLRLLQRQRTWTDAVELFVHPDTVLLDTRAVGFLKDVEGVTTQNLSSSDVSFHALRDYVPGDDRRAIHWRTTARVGRLMVRQFEETMRSHLLLILSLSPADYADEADFELAVSVLASLGMAAIREERELSVFTSDGLLDYPNAVGLLDQLCRLELRPRSKGLRELAADAAARVPGASVCAIIVGGTVEPATLRGAQLMLPTATTTFALRCGHGLAAARRRASTLLVLDISTLADLQRGMRTLR